MIHLETDHTIVLSNFASMTAFKFQGKPVGKINIVDDKRVVAILLPKKVVSQPDAPDELEIFHLGFDGSVETIHANHAVKCIEEGTSHFAYSIGDAPMVMFLRSNTEHEFHTSKSKDIYNRTIIDLPCVLRNLRTGGQVGMPRTVIFSPAVEVERRFDGACLS